MRKNKDDTVLTEEQKRFIETYERSLDKGLDATSAMMDAADQLKPLLKNKTLNQIDGFMGPLFTKFGMTPEHQKDLMSFILDPDGADKIKDNIKDKKAASAGGTSSPGEVATATSSHAGYGKFTDKDVRHMGLMLFVETAWSRSDIEHEAIIQVAINRALKWGKSIYEVVKPLTARPGWNNSKGYAARWQKGIKVIDGGNSPRWERTKKSIIRCFKGNSSVNIGDAMNFLHPNGMTPGGKCISGENCPGSKRKCVDYDKIFPGIKAGKRCIPTWAIHTSKGGKSKTVPKLFGKALVCNGTVDGVSPISNSERLANRGGGSTELAKKVRTNQGNSEIIGLGDSITVGYGYTSWIDFVGGKKFARGGWSSTAIKNLIFYNHIFDKKSKKAKIIPKYLIILAGINNHLRPQKVIDDLSEMAEVAQASNIKVKIMALLPTGGYWDKSKRYPEGDALSLKRVGTINKWIRGESWVKVEGSGAIDTSAMGDSSGKLLNSGDGLHPNKRGQKALALIVQKSLKA